MSRDARSDARYRNCWALFAEHAHTFTLRPYLYEDFFDPDAPRRAVPLMLDVLELLTEHCPLLIEFACGAEELPAADALAACASAFGAVKRDPNGPSFLLRPDAFPRDLLAAFLYDPDSAFHVSCHVPRRVLLDRFDVRGYAACRWLLAHGLSRMHLDSLSGRPMLEIRTDAECTPEFLLGRIAPMVWRHGCRVIKRLDKT